MKTYSILFTNGDSVNLNVQDDDRRFSNSINLDHLGWETLQQENGKTIAINFKNAVLVKELDNEQKATEQK